MPYTYFVYDPMNIESVIAAASIKTNQMKTKDGSSYPVQIQDFLSFDLTVGDTIYWIGTQRSMPNLRLGSQQTHHVLEGNSENSLLEVLHANTLPELNNPEMIEDVRNFGYAAAVFNLKETGEALLKKAYAAYLIARPLLTYDIMIEDVKTIMSYEEGVRRAKLNINRAVTHNGSKFFTTTDETWPIMVRLLTMAGAKYSMPVAYLNIHAQAAMFDIGSK